jgi:hypothetical protein
MAVAFVQEFDVGDDRTTTNYDAIKQGLNPEVDRPAGLIVHTAGFTEDGVFRIFDVWESEEDWNRFNNERLMPIIERVMSESPSATPPAREYTYELHDVVPA